MCIPYRVESDCKLDVAGFEPEKIAPRHKVNENKHKTDERQETWIVQASNDPSFNGLL
jgi:hypothetical protein